MILVSIVMKCCDFLLLNCVGNCLICWYFEEIFNWDCVMCECVGVVVIGDME